MTTQERQILRDERVSQLLTALSQKAGIAKAMVEAYGSDAKQVVKKDVERDIRQWVESVRDDHDAKDINRNINGMHRFFWGPNEDEKMVYTFEDTDKSRTYTVTECPLAVYAREHGIEEWAAMFFCDNYNDIAHTYNDHMSLSFEKKMMDGADCCRFTFHMKKSISV